jgi:3-hydroxyisobutyrate dehydrogenase-like beta-hydroxyacid dehydrogenase
MPENHDCGIVGLGTMGSAIASHLIDDGWTVIGYDQDRDALTSAVSRGVTAAETPAAVASRVDIVLTSLPTPEAIETVYTGTDGIASGADEGLVALEMSTNDPDTTRSIAADADGVTLLDAPVSGGPERAEDGTLTLMVGGDRATFDSDRVQTVLDSLAEDIYYLGSLGAGHTTKLLNNQIGACVRAISLEAAAVAAVQDLDMETFMRVIRHSSGSSYQFRKRVPRAANRDFDPGFTNEMTRKDVRLALDMADSTDAPTFITSTVYELYKRAVAEGLGSEDSAAVIKLYEESTGVPFESDEQFDDDFLDWKEL